MNRRKFLVLAPVAAVSRMLPELPSGQLTGFAIQNLAPPVMNADAAPKAYIDGVPIGDGSVLVTGQSNPALNGIWPRTRVSGC